MGAGSQLNLRLPEHEREVLDAVAFLAASTPTEIAREVLVEYLERQAQRERVRHAMELRTEEAADG